MPLHLTIGYDAKRAVSNGTGLGNYCRTLLNDLGTIDTTDSFRLYVPDLGRDDLRSQLDMPRNMSFVTPANKLVKPLRSLWRIKGIVNDLKRDGVDIYHGLTGELPLGLSEAGIKSVVTIHDLIFMRCPEYYNPVDVAIYKWKFRNTCKQADRIIAISECTRRDIMELGEIDDSRINVVYQSCGTRFCQQVGEAQKAEVRSRYSLPQRYILFVGTIEERKNALLAAQALPYLSDEIHLVLVGRQTAYAKTITSFARQNGLANRIHMLSGVPTSDLYAIYQQAECFVYPSRYEGFGIPVIEAIQSRLPVIACTGSCLEEAGGPDNVYVDPDEPQEMAMAIKSITDNPDAARQIVTRSLDYIRRFENGNVAQEMLNVYRSL
ncbi:glycosyltransferase family 1 protein [Prevotella sp. P3-122]|uniref:glycosyltransferase family 4 protein n=1 Tax=Prevotella sp. P3-122 TaxID=2024223 RepID=UPI000B97010A|nr:glycosyltransferase family 1 protein [Prevotella sp. P3-122]OYP63980.1 mannosyltransferase [Prevotella sp. P3-122]